MARAPKAEAGSVKKDKFGLQRIEAAEAKADAVLNPPIGKSTKTFSQPEKDKAFDALAAAARVRKRQGLPGRASSGTGKSAESPGGRLLREVKSVTSIPAKARAAQKKRKASLGDVVKASEGG